MKINSPNKAKIIVELTRDDMTELDITYESMDYSNIETRRVIWTILDKARHELHRDIDPSGKMTIETIPLDTGGCVIFFTVNDIYENIKTKTTANEEVYEFENLDSVIDLYSAIKEDFPSCKLYTNKKGKFRLITRADDRMKTKLKLREYSHLCSEGKLTAEMTREHWSLQSVNFGISSE